MATPDLASLQLAVEATGSWFEQYVATVDRSALAETITFQFTDGDRGQMTREEMLFHVITHGAWHRGEVGQILTRLRLRPTSDTGVLAAVGAAV